MGVQPIRAALTHPVAIGALAVLLVNDHLLKAAWPSWWTGKLSDVAALIVGPLALAAAWQLATRQRRRTPIPETVLAIGCAVVFIAVKVDPTANAAYAIVAGLVGWPIGALGDLVAGRSIQGIGLAPTMRDAGDLLALPAVIVGWWLSAGAPRRASGLSSAHPQRPTLARVVVLGLACFALAATSRGIDTSVTEVARDVVTVPPGDQTVHRQATIHIRPTNPPAGAQPPHSIRIQARARWPRNDPAVAFTVSYAAVPAVTGTEPVVAIPTEPCADGCSLDVDVAIAWPGSTDRAPVSVPWELVATVDQGAHGAYTGIPAPSVEIMTVGFRHLTGDRSWPIGALAILPILAFGAGAGPVRRRLDAARPGQETMRAISAVVGLASVAAAAVVVTAPIVLQADAADSPGAGSSTHLLVIAWLAGGALILGLGQWLRGDGGFLPIAAVATGLVGLPTVAVFVGAAAGPFAERGALIGLVLAGLLTVIAILAPIRPRQPSDGATASRTLFVASQVALMGVLVLAAPGSTLVVGLIAAGVLGFCLWTWSEGYGPILGLMSATIVGVAGFALLANPSPSLGETGWTATEQLVATSLVFGGLIGFFAATGRIAPLPKPEPWKPTDRVVAALAATTAGHEPVEVPPGPDGR